MSASLVFSTQLHKPESLQKAAYRFCNLAAVDIQPGASEILCTFNFLKPQSQDAANAFASDFKIEALDQELRFKIGAETAAMRNAVLAMAFSKTGFQGGE